MHKSTILLIVVLISIISEVNSQEKWEWTHPQTTSNDLRFITFINGQFIATGRNNIILLSKDGKNWEKIINQSIFEPIVAATYGAGKIVLLEKGGSVHASDDNGYTWKEYKIDYAGGVTGIAWGKGPEIDSVFVVVTKVDGQGRSLFHSADLEDWNNMELGNFIELRDVIFADGLFTAVGNRLVAKWKTKFEWEINEEFNLGTSFLNIINVNNKYAMLADHEPPFLHEYDSIPDYTNTPSMERHYISDSVYSSLAYGNGKYVCTYERRLYCINDSGEFECITNLEIWAHIYSVAFGNGVFIAVSDNGIMFTSVDGMNWEISESSANYNLNAIEKVDNKFIIVGTNGTILNSLDGDNWRTVQSNVSLDLNDIAYGKDQFVVVGDSGVILTSSDGETWSVQLTEDKVDIKEVEFGNEIFVARSDHILTSDDGREWSLTSNRYDGPLKFNNGEFIADDYDYIVCSVDGINWEQKGSNLFRDIDAMCFNGSDYIYSYIRTGLGKSLRFVYNGGPGKYYEETTVDTFKVISLNYGNGMFVGGSNNGDILTLNDTLDYDHVFRVTDKSINDILYDNGTFYTVGDYGSMLKYECANVAIQESFKGMVSSNKNVKILNHGNSIKLKISKGYNINNSNLSVYNVSGQKIISKNLTLENEIIISAKKLRSNSFYIFKIKNGENELCSSFLYLK